MISASNGHQANDRILISQHDPRCVEVRIPHWSPSATVLALRIAAETVDHLGARCANGTILVQTLVKLPFVRLLIEVSEQAHVPSALRVVKRSIDSELNTHAGYAGVKVVMEEP